MEGDAAPLFRFSFFYRISIHSLRMEGDADTCQFGKWTHSISIHSLRMEGDKIKELESEVKHEFQSTPSAWRETGTGTPGIYQI